MKIEFQKMVNLYLVGYFVDFELGLMKLASFHLDMKCKKI